MIRSILVANRGEIARRVFRTAGELGIATVAVHSDADAHAPFVAEADRAVRLPGNAPADTYLRGDLVIEAAQSAGADAIHPGYGFLSENAEFARQVAAAGLTWIGPHPDTIDAMGSKIEAKKLMKAAGVPILEVDPATASADDFPLLVKASAGGGGRGMRVVERPDDLQGELEKAAVEAASAFGDGTVFVEPYLPTARHVEVQVLADAHGTVWILGDRDCSIQRRHQKVVEEAPAPGLTDGTRKTLHDAARAAAQAVNYVGAGTVEFLVQEEKVFFLEMNTRLQVEHPVTEEIFGVDLVALQIAVAEGAELGDEPTHIDGHAIEVRLYAEDPTVDYAPQTGTLRTFEIPSAPGLRVDSAVESGSEVGIHYDAMIAKIIAHGPDRATAIRTLDGALRRARIHGVITNRDLLRSILGDDEFAAGRVHTALLGERIAAWTSEPPDTSAAVTAAAVASAVHAAQSSPVLSRIPIGYHNLRSQPRVRTFTVESRDEELAVSYVTNRDGTFALDDFTVVAAGARSVTLERDGVRTTYDVRIGDHTVDVDGPEGSFSFVPVPRFVDPSDAVAEGSLLAPMPAAVTHVAVEAGQAVSKGDVIVVLEAMKMQHTITAPADGTVAELDVSVGQQVESGAVLAVIEGDES
ncbi:MAG TPA: biotin carboxylase N-terminal domain-containing protein [Aeromicrobium sp.]|nr:biotin carboxylase N-terminal domain-containing protein [Aeromicrobium sp.]